MVEQTILICADDFAESDAEPARDAGEHRERRVQLGSFELTDVLPADVAVVGDLLLGQAFAGADFAEDRRERFALFGREGCHVGTFAVGRLAFHPSYDS